MFVCKQGTFLIRKARLAGLSIRDFSLMSSFLSSHKHKHKHPLSILYIHGNPCKARLAGSLDKKPRFPESPQFPDLQPPHLRSPISTTNPLNYHSSTSMAPTSIHFTPRADRFDVQMMADKAKNQVKLIRRYTRPGRQPNCIEAQYMPD